MKASSRRLITTALLPFMLRGQIESLPGNSIPISIERSKEERAQVRRLKNAAWDGRKPNGNGRVTGIAKARRAAKKRRRAV